MLEAIIKGFILGLLIGISIGPVFFMLLDTSISRGFNKGFLFSMGAYISDLLLVTLLLTGTLTFLVPTLQSPVFKLVGGIIFIIFGIAYGFSKKIKQKFKANAHTDFLKGFFINALNPFVYIFWITIITLVISDFQRHILYTVTFFVVTFAVLLIMNIIKILAARKLKNLTTDRHLAIIRLITGLVFIFFGIFMIGEFVMVHFPS